MSLTKSELMANLMNQQAVGKGRAADEVELSLQIFSVLGPPSVGIFLAKGRQVMVLSLRLKHFQLCFEVQRTQFC